MEPQRIAAIIDQSPLNRGMDGNEWMADQRNIAVAIGGNIMLFELQAEGLCEFHWLDMKAKGRQAITDTQDAMRGIFRDTTARVIYGLIPKAHRSSRIMARWIGAKYVSDISTEHGVCQIYAITPALLEGTE